MNIFELLKRSAARLLFIPRAAYASWLTETAFDLAAEGKDEKSKAKLDAARNCAGMLTKEGKVLEIYLLYQLNEYELSVFKANEFESSVAAIEIGQSRTPTISSEFPRRRRAIFLFPVGLMSAKLAT